MAKLVSKVYGDALFEDAMDKGKASEWLPEAEALKGIFQENLDLAAFLNHPQIEKEEKIQVLKNIFSGRTTEDFLGFFIIVVEKGRQDFIVPILDYFIDRVKEYKKIGVVSVTSAAELSEEQKKKIENRILETTAFVSLETEYRVDPDLIGGLVIRIGDRVVDSSIRTQLLELKRELLKIQLA